jgi:hypothetical protein
MAAVTGISQAGRRGGGCARASPWSAMPAVMNRAA